MMAKKKLLYLAYRLRGGDFRTQLDEIRSNNGSDLSRRYWEKLKCVMGRRRHYPLLTKDGIRTGLGTIKQRGIGRYKNSSGGSTGEPVTFWQDNEYRNWCNATERFYYERFLGIDYDVVKKVVLWGSERDTMKQGDLLGKMVNWLSNTVFLNTFNVSEADWLRYIKIINMTKPVLVKGYAGSLYQMAKVINDKDLKVYHPRFVYSSAETLRDFMRQEIEKAFGVKVYDFYGSREVGPIAGECIYGRHHVFCFNNKVEVVGFSDDRETKGEGRIVVTNLHNYSMPLVRYVIGDVGSMGVGRCPCGNDLPWLKTIGGRVTDYFRLKNGGVVHGEFFTHLFYFREWVKKFQVNQIDYDLIEILIVKGSSSIENSEKSEIENKIRRVMGTGCRIRWKCVDKIPSTKEGKYLFTRSLVV